MKILNNRGVSLIELLAVIVILGMLIMILVPNVNKLLIEGQQKRYNELKDSISSATKIYISDYKYTIKLEGDCPQKRITSINSNKIEDNKIPIEQLVTEGYIETDKNNNITNPKDRDKKLNTTQSYIVVTYDCNTKDFEYGSLYYVWE